MFIGRVKQCSLIFTFILSGIMPNNVKGATSPVPTFQTTAGPFCSRPDFTNPYAIVLDPDQPSYPPPYFYVELGCKDGHTPRGLPEYIYCYPDVTWNPDPTAGLCYAQCNTTELVADDDIIAIDSNDTLRTIFDDGESAYFYCADQGQFSGSNQGTCRNGTLDFIGGDNPSCLAYCPVYIAEHGDGLYYEIANDPVINEDNQTLYYRGGDSLTYRCSDGYDGPINCTSIDCTSTCDDGIWDPTGIPVCEDIDECLSDPCQNNATCNDLIDKYECECLNGFNGTNCEINIDKCANHTCQNGATCIDLVSSFDCECPEGFHGTYCENEIDECSSNPCQNNATCNDLFDEYECICLDGFKGTNCENGDDQFDCDFDSGLCGWTQDVTDSFDWTVRSGSTPSSSTGPISDHTTGYGQYTYTETSSPRVQGDVARLTSPEVVARGTQCLQFYYHMYGATIGSLNVYVSKVGDPLGIPLFQIVGEQGNSWNLARVDITRADTDRFVATLEGIRGSSHTGDIAIDDIIMFSGGCSETELICDSTSMTLLLDRDLLKNGDDARDVHFEDESCVGYDHDSQRVAITTMYNRCNTKQEQEEDNMVFSNMVTYYKPRPENGTSGIITREHYLHIPVTCYLKRERILEESFTPDVDKYTYDEEGYGEFSLSLDRYTNAGFYQHANDSGMVELGTPLYFGVTLNSVTNLTLLIESCWATSSPYPLDDHRYDIIEDGCAVDTTTYIYYTSSPTFERFRVDAFTFIGDYDKVYVHCSILICDYRDTGSRCAQGCLSRARRGLQPTGSRSKPHTITNGPLSDASHFKHTMMVDNDNDGGETHDPLMIAVLSALCVLIALTVIMSLVVIRMRHRHGPEMIAYRRVGVAEDY